MTLKQQLLVVGALTLLIPLAGIQFVVQLEQALKAQELARMSDQLSRVAGLVGTDGNHTVEKGASSRVVFAESFTRQLILDGYGDDWPNRPDQDGAPLLYPDGEHLQWRAALKDDHLWLFLKIEGLQAVFTSASDSGPGDRGDRVRLYWQEPDSALQARIVEARGPGRVRVLGAQGRAIESPQLDGIWQTRPAGYTVELRLPRLRPGSRFGFNLEHPAGNSLVPIGSLGPASRQSSPSGPGLPLLMQDQPGLQATLRPFAAPGQSMTLVTREGWQLAHAQGSEPRALPDIDSFGPLELLQRMVLQGLRLLLSANQEPGDHLGPVGALWRGAPLDEARQVTRTAPATFITRDGQGEVMLTAIAPVRAERAPLAAPGGPQPGAPSTSGSSAQGVAAEAPQRYLISRLSTDALLSLSSATLGQVLSRSLLFMIVLLLILAGYASWLSWRITGLSRAVHGAVDGDGRVLALMEPSRSSDELGELSRHFARQVAQVRGYTHYLESFARKLSHELKTPLAVMRSSLDNLRHCEPTPDQLVYLDRASDGAERLSRILVAMSEATRLEKSLKRTTAERFDLAPVVRAAAESYGSLDPRVRYQGPEQACPVLGSADLLIQALDKLVENARDFTPPEGHIDVILRSGSSEHTLDVCNEGPALPENMAEHIFDSFVTLREPGRSDGHLGQGLVIVKLVADFHQGRISAANSGGGGVCFSLSMPASDGRAN